MCLNLVALSPLFFFSNEHYSCRSIGILFFGAIFCGTLRDTHRSPRTWPWVGAEGIFSSTCLFSSRLYIFIHYMSSSLLYFSGLLSWVYLALMRPDLFAFSVKTLRPMRPKKFFVSLQLHGASVTAIAMQFFVCLCVITSIIRFSTINTCSIRLTNDCIERLWCLLRLPAAHFSIWRLHILRMDDSTWFIPFDIMWNTG